MPRANRRRSGAAASSDTDVREPGPLHGTLVVEFGNLIAAPYAAMLLADMGARVIKVEPIEGDLGRGFGPYQNGESTFFMMTNRGKESLCLDTKDWLSKRVLDNVVKKSDVLVHNLRHGAIDRLGFGESRARELNPRIVYASISAFGAEGPYAARPGIDVVFQGESGMISITGDPKDGPRKTATTIGDYVAGTNAAMAIAAALAERPRRSRRIDVSLRDGVMAVQSGWNALALTADAQPDRTGTASPYLAPNQVFEAADAPFTLAIVSERHFRVLVEALGLPELVDAYPDNQTRMAKRQTLARRLSSVFKTEKADHWVSLLGDVGLPVGHVLELIEALTDPQARHNEMIVEYDHPVAGKVRTTGSPIHVDGAPARAPTMPPSLGSHTRAILAEMGVAEGTIDQMISDGTAKGVVSR
ncbi:MAG TPA: CoA transferase [Acidimicrobiia bacterium]|nr:CoA transferase [Acidimicrobiia bacterium]